MIFVFIPKDTLGSEVSKNSSHSSRHFFLLLSYHFEQCGRTDVPTEPTLLSKWAPRFSATQAGGCVRSWLPLV